MENSNKASWPGPAEVVVNILRCIGCKRRLKTVSAGMACKGTKSPLSGSREQDFEAVARCAE